jgi:small GTP-binding protein
MRFGRAREKTNPVVMGAAPTKLRQLLHPNQDVRILMCGLDAAGKTSILYQMKLGALVTTIPTIGFNVETISKTSDAGKNLNLTVWDVSGRGKIRPLWRHYFQNTDAVIYVIDSNDRERMEETTQELHQLLRDDELTGAALLVLCNKQDLPGVMSVAEIQELLRLEEFHLARFNIFPVSALDASSLDEVRILFAALRDLERVGVQMVIK